MTTLLDGNVLVALTVVDHAHHPAAQRWLETHEDGIATCPITQGTLLRVLIRGGTPATEAEQVLAAVVADVRHEFWPDSIGYTEVALHSVIGHRQVTDAYLAQLAQSRGGTLATFDKGLAAAHPGVTELVPVEDHGST